MLYATPRPRRWSGPSAASTTSTRAAAQPAARRSDTAPPAASTASRAAPPRPLWDGHGWGRDEELAYRDALRNLPAAQVRERAVMTGTPDARTNAGGVDDDGTRGLAHRTLLTLSHARPRDDRLLRELSHGWGELEKLATNDD